MAVTLRLAAVYQYILFGLLRNLTVDGEKEEPLVKPVKQIEN